MNASVFVCSPCKWSGYAWRWVRWWQEDRGREGGRETEVEAGFEMPQSFNWSIVLKRKSFLVSLKFLHIFTLTAEMLFFFGISKGLWSYSVGYIFSLAENLMKMDPFIFSIYWPLMFLPLCPVVSSLVLIQETSNSAIFQTVWSQKHHVKRFFHEWEVYLKLLFLVEENRELF